MKYDIILTDIDNTLLDFSADARHALEVTLTERGLPFNDTEWKIYHDINDALWKAFDEGKIEKSMIYPERFRRYLEARGIEADHMEYNLAYMKHLAQGNHQYPDSRKLLETLKAMGCEIYGATNGEATVQTTRMTTSGLRPLFDGMYISEQMGTQKPAKAYFDMIFKEIGEEKRKRAIMLGDSLSSDMQGGRNAGIATCFFGKKEKADERCDYVIEELMQFVDVVK